MDILKPAKSHRGWFRLLGGLPLAALALWTIRLVPQASLAHAAVAHCESWVAGLDHFQETLARLQVQGYAMHHGGSFGMEQAAMQESLDAYWRARGLLAARTHHEEDPRLDALDRAMVGYLAQLNRVLAATKTLDRAKGLQDGRVAERALSSELAQLSRQFKAVMDAYDDLETFHQRFLEASIQRVERHNQELTAFASVALLIAIAFILLGVHAGRLKDRAEDAAALAHALLDAAPIGILVWDAAGRIHHANPRLGEILGRPYASIKDAPIATVLPGPVHALLEEAEPSHVVAFNVHCPDGRFAAFEAGTSVAVFSGLPFRVAAVEDVSRRLQAERRIQERSRQAELGVRVSGSLHDLERLIHPILLASDMLQAGGKAPEKVNDLLGLLDRNGRAAATLVAQLVRLTHESERDAQPELFELHACLWEAITSLELPPGLQLDAAVPEGACLVRGDRSDAGVALRALLQRGATAAGPGGLLRIASRPHGHSCLIEISDSGDNIPDADLSAILAPSYVAHSKAEGPDLSRLPSILRAMGGDLTVARGSTGQTTFTLRFPVLDV